MGILSQKSFLGEATSRLYRALNLSGVLGLLVDDTIQPVIVVTDATGPGMGDARGRRFQGGSVAAGPALTAAFNCYQDCVITRVTIGCDQNAGADTLALRFSPILNSVQTPNVAYLDRAASTADVFQANMQGIAFGAFGSLGTGLQFQVPGSAVSAAYFFEAVTSPFFMQAGSALYVQSGTARNVVLNIEGRSF